MDDYLVTGRFPPLPSNMEGDAKAEDTDGYVETEVRTKSVGEFTRIYVVLGTVYLVWRSVARVWGKLAGSS